MEIRDFIKWYEEAYNSGDLNPRNARECAAFLTGLAAMHPPREMQDGSTFDPVSSMLDRCVSTLHGVANLQECLERKKRGGNTAETGGRNA